MQIRKKKIFSNIIYTAINTYSFRYLLWLESTPYIKNTVFEGINVDENELCMESYVEWYS